MNARGLEAWLTAAFLGLGIGILALAYAVICVRTGNIWPWSEVVHEDGVRTLTATVLYFEHGARELPIDLFLGVAIGGCLLFARAPDSVALPQGPAARPSILGPAMATGLAVAVILAGAAHDVGLAGLRDNLLQYHTRPQAPLEWGAHWRYHLLSRLALIFGCLGIAGFLRFFLGGTNLALARRGLWVFGATLLGYLAVTGLLLRDLPSLLLPFHDPVYLGHQAREAFTHVLATVPLTWGICLLLTRPNAAAVPEQRARTYAWPLSAGAAALGAALGLYVGTGALINDSAAQGQIDDLAMLIFPHFFEHVQGYVAIPATAMLTYRLAQRRAA